MAESSPENPIRFDLGLGRIGWNENAARAGSEELADARRLVVLPSSVFTSVAAHLDAEALSSVGAATGRRVGERVVSHFGGTEAVRAAPLEAVVTLLAKEVSLLGFGALKLEQWGRAIVFVVEHPVANLDSFTAALVASAVETATGSPARRIAAAGQPSV